MKTGIDDKVAMRRRWHGVASLRLTRSIVCRTCADTSVYRIHPVLLTTQVGELPTLSPGRIAATPCAGACPELWRYTKPPPDGCGAAV